LDYDPSPSSNDILIHVGDILAKGTVSDSLRVLDWMTTRNITGVRGNHDQDVIEWKSWRDWIRQSKDGRHWLDRLDRQWEESIQNGTDAQDPAQWLERQKSKTWHEDKNLWKMLPKGWKMNMFGEQYLIASAMKQEHYDYLLSLPLILHVPSHHAFIAHAGMLPSDPSRSSYSPRQPLAHIPNPPKIETTNKRTTLRNWQEMSLINDVPQNNDPWVLLNVRSLMKDHTVTRNGNEGIPWSQTWNNMMNRCSGYSSFSAIQSEGDTFSEPLPCLPSTVIYGHSASRGLDVNRWSFGLDSGCVYGRRLTALVLEFLTRDHTLTLEDLLDSDDNSIYGEGKDISGDSSSLSTTKRRIRFGDDGEQPADAYLVDVECR